MNMTYDMMFGSSEAITKKLKYLIDTSDPSCIVISLSPTLECHIRVKIDPMTQHKGCLIIIRIKNQKTLSAIQERQIKMETMESIEIERDCTLFQAVEEVASALIEKYKIKQNQLLDLIKDQESLVNRLEEEHHFENTVLEDYLINHKLRTAKKSIRFVNMNTITGNNVNNIYRSTTLANSEQVKGEKKKVEKEDFLDTDSLYQYNSQASSVRMSRKSVKSLGSNAGSGNNEEEDYVSVFNYDVRNFHFLSFFFEI